MGDREKGLLLVGLNKRYSLLRVALGQGSLITRIFYYFLISHEGYPIFPRLFSQHFFPSHTFPPENFFSQWGALIDGHVIAVGNPKIMIESLSGGEKIRMMPQVPFTNAGRCVTSRLQHLGQRDLIGVQPGGIFREKHSRNMDPSGITTGEQCGPRGRAHRVPRIKIGEPHALLGQLIQVRCLDVGRSIATEILIPLIIGHDENDIWNRCCQRAKGHRGKPTDGNGAALEPRAAGCSILL